MKTKVTESRKTSKKIVYPQILKDDRDYYVLATSDTNGTILSGEFMGDIYVNDNFSWEEAGYYPVNGNVTIQFIRD